MSAEENLQKKEAEEKERKKQLLDKKQKEEAAKAAKAEKEAKEAEEKAAKEKEKAEKEAAKKKKKTTLKDLVKEYGLEKVKDNIFIPSYFTEEQRFADQTELRVEEYHARNFLLGLEIFAEQGSCSAKITYIGPNRRYSLRNVTLGMRQPHPKQNNWKLFKAPVRLLKGEEHNSKIKDSKIIRDLLTSLGGKKNFEIRFVRDKEFTRKEAKKQVYAKDPVRLQNLNYRIKKDQALLGVKPVLRDKREANLLLNDLASAKGRDIKHVIEYLSSEIKRFEAIETKLKEEEKKD